MKYFKYVIPIFFFLLLTSAEDVKTIDELLVELDEIGDTQDPSELDRKSIIANKIAIYFQTIEEMDEARLYLLKAIDFTEKRIEIEQKWDAQNLNDMATLYSNLAAINASAGKIDQAKAAFRKYESFLYRQKSKLTPEEFQIETAELNHAGFLWAYHSNQYEIAEDYILKSLKIYERFDKYKNLVFQYRQYGVLLVEMNRYDEAHTFYDRAISLHKKHFPEKHVPYKLIKANSALLYAEKKYQEVIDFITENTFFQSTEALRNCFQNADLSDKKVLLNTSFILSFAYIRGHLTADHPAYLTKAYSWQEMAYLLAEETVVQHGADKLGTILSNSDQNIISTLKNVELLKKTGQLKQKQIGHLLRILDIYNSTKLHLNRLNNELNLSIWQQQKQLNLELEELTSMNPDWKDKTISDNRLDSIRDRCYEISMEIKALDTVTKRDKLLNEYQIGQQAFISQLEDYVAKNQKTAVCYYWSDQLKMLYIIGVREGGYFFENVPTSEDFPQMVQNAYSLNSRLNIRKEDIAKQRKLNKKLYEYFIQPIEEKFDQDQELLVYPFGIASYVSFDALIQPNERYMVEDFTTSYTSSLFSILRPNKKKTTAKAIITSFYPTNYGTDSLAFLLHGKKEIESFNAIEKSRSFNAERASKRRFIRHANSSKILHVASHSVLNTKDSYKSYLLFDAESNIENKMYAYEIFAQSFDAELVTLSSCNSASGSVEDGIGMVSLANAFYFSGIPATIGSMWSAQDKSSSEIMISFYSHLFDGKKKSESLALAKRNYLSQSDQITSQPFFWASYVLYGSDTAVEVPKELPNTNWFYLGGAFIFLVLLIVYLKASTRLRA